MTTDTYQTHTLIAELGPIYRVASRRAEQAARRGDVKTAASWLAVAQRHLDMVERINRGSLARTRVDIQVARLSRSQR